MSSFTRGVANVDDLLSSTLDKYRNELTEQWITASPMTKKLWDGRSEVDGGNDIVEHVEFAANGTSGFGSKTAAVDTSISQIFTDTRFAFAWHRGTVGIYDYEEGQNNGKEAWYNLLEKRLKNFTEAAKIDLEVALGQASTPDANTPWSLPDIVDASNPTLGNFGDVDRSVYSWWQGYELASGSMASQGLEDMRTAFLVSSRDLTDPVDVLLATQTLYLAYNGRMTAHEQLVSGDKGDLEFPHLAFHGKPLFSCSQLASGLILGYNSKYMKLIVNKNLKMKNQPFVRTPGGQSKSSTIQTQMQLVCYRPASNFKLTGMTA